MTRRPYRERLNCHHRRQAEEVYVSNSSPFTLIEHSNVKAVEKIWFSGNKSKYVSGRMTAINFEHTNVPRVRLAKGHIDLASVC